jgi:hypothetical protein
VFEDWATAMLQIFAIFIGNMSRSTSGFSGLACEEQVPLMLQKCGWVHGTNDSQGMIFQPFSPWFSTV